MLGVTRDVGYLALIVPRRCLAVASVGDDTECCGDAQGVDHLQGTSMPVDGTSQHSVLTYEVISTQVVQPDQTQALLPQYGQDLVTLVTCTPLGINTHRILVTGERVTPTPAADLERAGARPEVPGFPWWAVIIGGSIVALTGFVIYSGRSVAKPGDPAQG